MRIPYTVFSVERTKAPMQATLENGQTVTVAAPAVAVQLTHPAHGTLGLTLVGDDADEALERFQAGATVTLTIEA